MAIFAPRGTVGLVIPRSTDTDRLPLPVSTDLEELVSAHQSQLAQTFIYNSRATFNIIHLSSSAQIVTQAASTNRKLVWHNVRCKTEATQQGDQR